MLPKESVSLICLKGPVSRYCARTTLIDAKRSTGRFLTNRKRTSQYHTRPHAARDNLLFCPAALYETFVIGNPTGIVMLFAWKEPFQEYDLSSRTSKQRYTLTAYSMYSVTMLILNSSFKSSKIAWGRCSSFFHPNGLVFSYLNQDRILHFLACTVFLISHRLSWSYPWQKPFFFFRAEAM